MATPREMPYVWVTWVSKFMAGELQCEWAAWFRAHHMYDKRPSDFNLAKWTADHATLVRDCAVSSRTEGYEVRVEDQNAFKMRGQNDVVLAGKPDLVIERDREVCIVDCKTGSPRVSDHMQVLIYMLILPYVRPIWKAMPVHGRLQYRHDSTDIPSRALDDRFRDRFRQTMLQIGGGAPLIRLPSYGECQFCDISRRDCPDRVDTPPPDVMPEEHNLF
jgi:hypothetical protein